MIEATRLSKRLGGRVIFRQLAFSWPNASTICICGENGSGKTTLLSMIAGLLAPDQGDILVNARSVVGNPENAAACLAYVPDQSPVYPFLRGQEWLAFVQSLRPCDQALEQTLIDEFALRPYLNTRFDAMSLGTAKKFLLVSALIRQVGVLVLDEPTNGLDAQSFETLRRCLQSRPHAGTVVMTCHNPEQRRQLGVHEVELRSLESA